MVEKTLQIECMWSAIEYLNQSMPFSMDKIHPYSSLIWVKTLARIRVLAVHLQKPFTGGSQPSGQQWWCWGQQNGGRAWWNQPIWFWGDFSTMDVWIEVKNPGRKDGMWRCPNQDKRRCGRWDDAVGSSWMLLMCCCQNTCRGRLWHRMSNTSICSKLEEVT